MSLFSNQQQRRVTSVGNNYNQSNLCAIEYDIMVWKPEDMFSNECQNIKNKNQNLFWTSTDFNHQKNFDRVMIIVTYPAVTIKQIYISCFGVPQVKFKFYLRDEYNQTQNEAILEQQLMTLEEFSENNQIKISQKVINANQMQLSNSCLIIFQNQHYVEGKSQTFREFQINSLIFLANKDEYNKSQNALKSQNNQSLVNNPEKFKMIDNKVNPKEQNLMSSILKTVSNSPKNSKNNKQQQKVKNQDISIGQIEGQGDNNPRYIKTQMPQYNKLNKQPIKQQENDVVNARVSSQNQQSSNQRQIDQIFQNSAYQKRASQLLNQQPKQEQQRDMIQLQQNNFPDSQNDDDIQRAIEQSKITYQQEQKKQRFQQRVINDEEEEEEEFDNNFGDLSQSCKGLNSLKINSLNNSNQKDFKHSNNNVPNPTYQLQMTPNFQKQFGLSGRDVLDRAKKKHQDIKSEDQQLLFGDPRFKRKNDVEMTSDIDEEEDDYQVYERTDKKQQNVKSYGRNDYSSTPNFNNGQVRFDNKNNRVPEVISLITPTKEEFDEDQQHIQPRPFQAFDMLHRSASSMQSNFDQNSNNNVNINNNNISNQSAFTADRRSNANNNANNQQDHLSVPYQHQPYYPLLNNSNQQQYTNNNNNNNPQQNTMMIQQQQIVNTAQQPIDRNLIQQMNEDEEEVFIHPSILQQKQLEALMLNMESDIKKKLRMKQKVTAQELNELQVVAGRLQRLKSAMYNQSNNHNNQNNNQNNQNRNNGNNQ